MFLDAETAQQLREHRKVQLAARLRAGEAWQDDDLIFCQADGSRGIPITCPSGLETGRGAGVPVIKLHEGGRHTGKDINDR